MPSPAELFAISKRSSSKELLGELLISNDAAVNGQRAVEPKALHEAFIGVAGLETVGDACYGYGASGLGCGVSVGLDIGMLVLPGMLNCEASVGVSASRSNQSFVCLIRQPRHGKLKEDLQTPFMFMNAAGVYFKGKLSVGVSAGVQARIGKDLTGNTTNMMDDREEDRKYAKGAKDERTQREKIALDIGAEAGFSASGSYEGEYAMVYDPGPAWYPQLRDPALVDNFTAITHVGSKTGTKLRIEQFFKEASNYEITKCFQGFTFWQSIRAKITGGQVPTNQLVQSLDDALALLNTLWTIKSDMSCIEEFLATLGRLETMNGKSSKSGGKLLPTVLEGQKKTVKKELAAYFSQPGLKALWPDKSWYRRESTLGQWKAALENVQTMAQNLKAEHYKWLTDQCAAHKKALELYRLSEGDVKKEGLKVEQTTPTHFLAHLCMWGHQAEVGAEVSVKADLSYLASVGAAMDYKRIWKSTQYRFQHFRPLPLKVLRGFTQNEVFTQDASLYYSQSYSHAGVNFDFATKPVFNKDWGASAPEGGVHSPVFNDMSYKIGHAVWMCPIAWGLYNDRTVLRQGSGLTYGQSVTIEGLQEALTHALSAEGRFERIPSESILRTYARCIRVNPNQLAKALKSMAWLIEEGVGAPDPLNKGRVIELKNFLLEGVFAAGEGLDVKIEWKSESREPKLHPDFRDELEKGQKVLQSIRLRYRKADALDQGTSFKLGIPAGFLKVGIELNSVQRAGSSGMVTLATHYFGELAELNNAPERGVSTWSAPESIVPEAVVFHQ